VKPGIHPNWYPDAVVTCACGNSWTTGSTKKEIHTDVCNKCHPFFTGEQRIVDTAGQVERFMKRVSAKEQIAASQPAPEDKKAKREKRRDRKPGTTVILPKTPAAPAELPLATVEEKPVMAELPALPVVETPKVEEPKPVVKIEEPKTVAKVEEPKPVVKIEERQPVVVEIPPVEMKVEKPAPVMPVAQVEMVLPEPVAVAPVEVVEEKKTKPRAVKVTVKKAVAKKPAAKAATKPKTAVKPKAAAKPKTTAKKPAPAKKTSPTKKAKK
jgi:large subunit ribosomal protein L31